MGEKMKFDKNGYLSTWDDKTYKEYYSKNRKERRAMEKSQLKQLKNKYNGRKNLRKRTHRHTFS